MAADSAPAPDTTPGVCPILTYLCATGCCPQGSEVVSDARGEYPDLIVDGGNVYATYAIPNGGVWQTGVAIYDKATATWRRSTVTNGYPGVRLRLSSTGRLHHHYARSSGPIAYRYSDDKGLTWKQLGTLPTSLNLMIGGACALDVDSQDRPHLICGMYEAYGSRGIPRYTRYDGSTWLSTLENFQGSMDRHVTLRLGFADRPHVVHTYGPTATDLHYTYYTGTQWQTEAIPLPANVKVHPDYTPGFELGAADTVHIAFTGYDALAKSYAAYYARRTLPGTWVVEKALGSQDLGGTSYSTSFIALDAQGAPVIFTAFGSGARRLGTNSWKAFKTTHEVGALAVEGHYAYVMYPVDGASYYQQRLHLTLVDMQ